MKKANLVTIAEELTSWRQEVTPSSLTDEELSALCEIKDTLRAIADKLNDFEDEVYDENYELAKGCYEVSRYLKR